MKYYKNDRSCSDMKMLTQYEEMFQVYPQCSVCCSVDYPLPIFAAACCNSPWFLLNVVPLQLKEECKTLAKYDTHPS